MEHWVQWCVAMATVTTGPGSELHFAVRPLEFGCGPHWPKDESLQENMDSEVVEYYSD